jgi:LuxR family maltose regulon positive regulatory protein
MSSPILATKLHLPQPRPGLVQRPRLIARLDEGLSQDCRLTLISASAGFGKTTLVSDWITNCCKPAAWLSLDNEDNDPLRFISYLIAAMQTIQPEFGEGLAKLLELPEQPRLEIILTLLINEISKIPNDFFLILDDYHLVDSKVVDQALTYLIEHQPTQMHLIVISREDPSLPVARLRGRGHCTEIRASDLRFTPEEAADFLNRVMGLNLSDQDVAALDIRTEGWIAGLQMAALSMQGMPDTVEFIRSFTGSHRFVLDYLLEEVLQHQPESIQTFLLQTSIAERFCGPLCDCLSPDSSSSGQITLEYLERSNLFIIPLDNERHWYRYHHLFADLLRKQLKQSKTPGEIVDLHIRASEWYEKNDLLLEAFRHATEANDIERAERLMEDKRIPENQPGVPMQILKWLESLPIEVLNSKPALWWKRAAMMINSYQTIGVEEILQSAEAALAAIPSLDIERDEWARNLIGKIAVARAMLAQTNYLAKNSLVQARRALEYLHPKNIGYRSSAIQLLGFAHYLLGDRDEAFQEYTEALSLARTSGDQNGVLMGMIRLGQIYEVNNDLHSALGMYEQAVKAIDGDPPPNSAVLFLGLARIYYDWNDLDKAEEFAQKSYQLAHLCEQVIDRTISCELFLSRLEITRGNPERANHYLTQAEYHAKQYDYAIRLPDIAAARAILCLQNGDIDTAAQLVQNEDRWLVRAQVLLAQGNPSDALDILVQNREKTERQKLQDQLMVTIVLQALAFQAQGEKELARQALKDALLLSKPGGFLRLYVDYGEPMLSLINDFRSAIKKNGDEQDHSLLEYVDKILDAFTIPVNRQSIAASEKKSGLIDPLSPREQEVLQLISQGLSNQEIAKRLFLALDTVKGHNRRIFEKLQVQRRTEAIARAHELGLI